MKKSGKNLCETIKNARIHETIQAQRKSFGAVELKSNTTPSDQEVCKIENSGKSSYRKKWRRSEGGMRCSRCGLNGHTAADQNCPAMGKTCRKCNGKNHFARQCMSRNMNNNNYKRKAFDSDANKSDKRQRSDDTSVQLVDEKGYFSNNQNIILIHVFCITSADVSDEIWCSIGGIEIKVVVDSGSKYNLVDRDSWSELKVKKIITMMRKKETDKKFKAYGGKELKLLGLFKAKIIVGQKETIALFVVDENGKILLDRDTATILKVLKIGYDVNQIAKRDPRFNKIKGIMVEIPVKSNVQGVVQRYREC